MPSFSRNISAIPLLASQDGGSFSDWPRPTDPPWVELWWKGSLRWRFSHALNNSVSPSPPPPPKPPDRRFQPKKVEFEVLWDPTMPPPPPTPPDSDHIMVVHSTSGPCNAGVMILLQIAEIFGYLLPLVVRTVSFIFFQELNLRPPAKPPNHDRRSENEEKRVIWVQSLYMAIPCNTWELGTGNGHQLEPFPNQMGQTQPNTAMRWTSKKCAMQWVEATKIQELIVEVFSSFVSPTISIRTSRFRNFLKKYAEEDTGYKTFGYKFEIGLKEIMHTLGIIMLCISAVVLLLHVFFHGFPILKLGWGIIGAAIPLNTSWWMIIFAQLLYITITKSEDTWSGFIWLAMVDLSGFVKPYLTSTIILCLQFSLGGFKLGLSCTGVLNSASNYIKLMKSIFNFQIVRELLSAPKIPFYYVSFHEVTGAYVNHIPVDELVAPKSSLLNCKPMNFGGGHLEPNLTYAKELIACIGLGNSLTICVEIESYDYMATLFKADYDTYGRKWVRHQNTWRFCHGQCIIAVTDILNHDIPLLQQLQHNQGCQISSLVMDLNRWEARKVGMTSLLLLGCLLAVRTFFGFHETGFWLALSIGKIERLQFAHMVSIVQIVQLDGTLLGCALPDMGLLIEPDSFAALVKWHGSSTYNTFCKIWQDWKNFYNLEDKVVFNGGSNVMNQNDNLGQIGNLAKTVKASEQLANEVGQMEGDPSHQGARRGIRERRPNKHYVDFVL